MTMEVAVTSEAMRHAKLQSIRHSQQTTQLFIDVNQQCQSTEWKKYNTFHGLAHPKITWDWGLPTMSIINSWLPWEGGC